MAELFQRDGFGMPVELAVSLMIPVLKGNGDIRNCYGTVKLLQQEMKVVERVLGKRLHGMVTVDEMQFGFMCVRGTIVVVLYVFCGP